MGMGYRDLRVRRSPRLPPLWPRHPLTRGSVFRARLAARQLADELAIPLWAWLEDVLRKGVALAMHRRHPPLGCIVAAREERLLDI